MLCIIRSEHHQEFGKSDQLFAEQVVVGRRFPLGHTAGFGDPQKNNYLGMFEVELLLLLLGIGTDSGQYGYNSDHPC